MWKTFRTLARRAMVDILVFMLIVAGLAWAFDESYLSDIEDEKRKVAVVEKQLIELEEELALCAGKPLKRRKYEVPI